MIQLVKFYVIAFEFEDVSPLVLGNTLLEKWTQAAPSNASSRTLLETTRHVLRNHTCHMILADPSC